MHTRHDRAGECVVAHRTGTEVRLIDDHAVATEVVADGAGVGEVGAVEVAGTDPHPSGGGDGALVEVARRPQLTHSPLEVCDAAGHVTRPVVGHVVRDGHQKPSDVARYGVISSAPTSTPMHCPVVVIGAGNVGPSRITSMSSPTFQSTPRRGAP